VLYYVGSTPSGTGAPTAPTAAGTYCVLASFAGSTDYLPAALTPLAFHIKQAKPTVQVTDAGGTYTGNPFTAAATVAGVVAGVDTTPASSLEGTGLTLLYYAGSSAYGTGSPTAPSAVGTYTVVASFAGSTDYAAAHSNAVTFKISAASTKSAVTMSTANAALHDAALLKLLS
jgi:hypothetical protein